MRGFSCFVNEKGDFAGRHGIVVLVVREHLEVVEVALFGCFAADQLTPDRDGILGEHPAGETGLETLDEPAVQLRIARRMRAADLPGSIVGTGFPLVGDDERGGLVLPPRDAASPLGAYVRF